tara:strand:+ start:186 stop:509 length:324 start_codon:yes stop_codon:yes gene_type:complete
MINELLFTLLGLLFAFQVGMMHTLKRCEALLHSFSNIEVDLDPQNAVDAMRDEVGGIIEDLMASMRTPTIADHLGGVISQFAQIQLMKTMKAEGMMEMPQELEESLN